MIAGDMNLNPGPIKMERKNNMWDDLSFSNCNLSVDLAEYQFKIDINNSNSGDKRSMLKNRGMHLIHLNGNTLLTKIEEFTILQS